MNDRTPGTNDERNNTDCYSLVNFVSDDDSRDLVRALCDGYGLSPDARAFLDSCDDRALRRAVVRHLGFPVLGGTAPRSVLDDRRRARAGAAVPGGDVRGATSEAVK